MTPSRQNQTDAQTERSEFHRPVEVDKIRDGYRGEITATPDERAALARRFSLLGIEQLQADIVITPRPHGVFDLKAKMFARVVQACVVTQRPVMENINCVFSVAYGIDSPEYWGSEKGQDLGSEEDLSEPPEPIVNGKIDTGECVAEQLILEITPYPRVHGASFIDISDDAPGKKRENGGVETVRTGRESPFAVLERLKQSADEKS